MIGFLAVADGIFDEDLQPWLSDSSLPFRIQQLLEIFPSNPPYDVHPNHYNTGHPIIHPIIFNIRLHTHNRNWHPSTLKGNGYPIKYLPTI